VPVNPLPYRLELTAEEFNTLQWLENRGYGGRLIECATVQDESGAVETQGAYGSRIVSGIVVLQYTESDAWSAVTGHDDDETGEVDPDFGTCAGADLLRKMLAFREGII